VYVCIYPELADIARKHGYALAIHGSVARDFDLICVPWIENPSNPETVVQDMCSQFGLHEVGETEIRLHGRVCYTLAVAFGECFLDLSFTPATPLSTVALLETGNGC